MLKVSRILTSDDHSEDRHAYAKARAEEWSKDHPEATKQCKCGLNIPEGVYFCQGCMSRISGDTTRGK